MSNLERLNAQTTHDVLIAAMDENSPAEVSVRFQERWYSFESMILAVSDDFVWVDFPTDKDSDLQCNIQFRVGDEICITFRRGHLRFIFNTKIDGRESYCAQVDSNIPSVAIRVHRPGYLQYSQRRVDKRIEVPVDKLVRASFWLGGREIDPINHRSHMPVMSGKVLDFSAGGCFLRTSPETAQFVELGDIVGLKLIFASESDEIILDAQMRHCSPDDNTVVMGFKFINIGESEQAAAAYEKIKNKYEEMTFEVPQKP